VKLAGPVTLSQSRQSKKRYCSINSIEIRNDSAYAVACDRGRAAPSGRDGRCRRRGLVGPGGDGGHVKLLDDPYLLVATDGAFPDGPVPLTQLDCAPMVAWPLTCDQPWPRPGPDALDQPMRVSDQAVRQPGTARIACRKPLTYRIGAAAYRGVRSRKDRWSASRPDPVRVARPRTVSRSCRCPIEAPVGRALRRREPTRSWPRIALADGAVGVSAAGRLTGRPPRFSASGRGCCVSSTSPGNRPVGVLADVFEVSRWTV
jgi:hypothetical protein